MYFEQSVVTKGGVTCIFAGSNPHALGFYSSMWLLDRFLENDRFQHVFVLALDRNVSFLNDAKIKNTSAKLNKLELIADGGVELFLSKIGSLSAAERKCSAAIVLSGSAFLISSQFNDKKEEKEVESEDQSQSARFLDLEYLVQCISQLAAGVLDFHASLHKSVLIAKIQNMCTNIVNIVPNNGTLPIEIIATCKTIRTSRGSTIASNRKVTEGEELLIRLNSEFCKGISVLGPLPMASKPIIPTQQSSSSTQSSSTQQASVPIVATPVLMEMPTTSTKTSQDSGSKKELDRVKPQSNKPLVIFDRSDPEWDEDSDPDGDLDL